MIHVLVSCVGLLQVGKDICTQRLLSPIQIEMENLIFSNDKLFHVCFPLDVPTFRAPKLFHAQVFNGNTKTFTNQKC
jgi:hypothetical protein